MKVFVLVARSTFLEFWRQPSVLLMLLVAIVGTGGGWWWRDFNLGDNEARFILNFGGGVQGIVGVLWCTIGVAQTWAREFEQNTANVLRTRAINSLAFVGGKVMGVWLMALLFLLLSTAWLVIIAGAKSEVGEIQHWLVGELSRAGKLGLIASCATWLASYGRSAVFVVLASWAIVLIGNLHGLIDQEAMGGRVLQMLVPDLRWYDSASNMRVAVGAMEAVGRMALYTAFYMVVFTGLAALSWRRRND